MLNTIFSKYQTKLKETDLEDKDDSQKPKNRGRNKNRDEAEVDPLEEIIKTHKIDPSVKSKCDNILKQYCTLYNEDKSLDKYSIKPLNHKYLEQKKRREDHGQTTGPEWFDMKAPELTPELKDDLKALQLRNIIDPTKFYKKMDRNGLPKFFQIGTIQDNILDGKKSRLKKSEVRERIAEEILETDVAKSYSLRKFEEIQSKRRNLGLYKTKLNKYKLKSKKKGKKGEFVVK
jgi:hypothetical protein